MLAVVILKLFCFLQIVESHPRTPPAATATFHWKKKLLGLSREEEVRSDQTSFSATNYIKSGSSYHQSLGAYGVRIHV
jgi:hypothetical protein